jgi:hypothetical protein
MGRILVGIGLVLVVAGLVVIGIERLTGGAGRGLPGDFTFRWGNVTVSLPLMTSIVVSIVLSVLLSLWAAAGRR